MEQTVIMIGLVSLGALLGVFAGTVMPLKTRLALKMAFVVSVIVAFVCGAGTIFVAQSLWNRVMVRKVRLNRDIDFARDSALKRAGEPAGVRGLVQEGSIGTQEFRKGKVVYLHFPVTLIKDDVEYVE